MCTRKKKQFLVLGGALILAAPLLASPAFADDDGPGNRTVDCSKSNASIQKEIDRVKHGQKVTIFVIGQCSEEKVVIEKDDITLSGNKDGDGTVDGGVTGAINVVGARRVRIEYLHITGPNEGVVALDGATVTISHNEIVDNVGDGIGAFRNALVQVNFNTITGNGRLERFEGGVDAGNTTTVRTRGNLIAENGYAAVEVGNLAYWRSEAFTAAPTDPRNKDIILQKGCVQGDLAGTCGDEDTIAVDCFRNGICDVRNAEITGFSFMSGMSYFDVRNTTINGDVGANGGSGIRLRGSVTGSGSVGCSSEAFAFGAASCGGSIPPPPP